MLVFRGAVYRTASLKQIAKVIVGYLWKWLARTGTTRQQLLSWFTKFLHCDTEQRTADILPTDIVQSIAKLMAKGGMNCGDFILELERALDHPPAGYRWKTDQYGHQILVSSKNETEEKAIVRGKRFKDKIFIGVWWKTFKASGKMSRRLQNTIKRNNGAVFWNVRLDDGSRQYGGFVVADESDADPIADLICTAAAAADEEGGGEHRLSAISMDGIAEHREVRKSDQVWLGCIRSIKFNWKYNLTDLLNGRIAEFKNAEPYMNLIRSIRDLD